MAHRTRDTNAGVAVPDAERTEDRLGESRLAEWRRAIAVQGEASHLTVGDDGCVKPSGPRQRLGAHDLLLASRHEPNADSFEQRGPHRCVARRGRWVVGLSSGKTRLPELHRPVTDGRLPPKADRTRDRRRSRRQRQSLRPSSSVATRQPSSPERIRAFDVRRRSLAGPAGHRLSREGPTNAARPAGNLPPLDLGG
jgi:hypothetical protein